MRCTALGLAVGTVSRVLCTWTGAIMITLREAPWPELLSRTARVSIRGLLWYIPYEQDSEGHKRRVAPDNCIAITRATRIGGRRDLGRNPEFRHSGVSDLVFHG